MIARLPFVAAAALTACAAQSEVYSDILDAIGVSPTSAHRALEAKASAFWTAVLDAAEEMKMAEHRVLFRDAAKVITDLPRENEYVRGALGEALERLRRADEAVLTQALASSELAGAKLRAPTAGEAIYSFFTQGQNCLQQAIRRFVLGGDFAERLEDQVAGRQADVLPALRGAADAAGGVLTDTRLASKLSFDVLKYDLYNSGVPKTPEAAKAIADRLVDASAETRRRFTQFVTQAVRSIADDAAGREDSAADVNAQALREAEARAEAAGTGAPVISI